MRTWACLLTLTLGQLAGCSGSGEGSPTECNPACVNGEACVAGSCEASPGDGLVDLGRYTRIATLSDGRTVVATYDAAQRSLVLITANINGAQQVRRLDGAAEARGTVGLADVGRWPSLAVDANDKVHITWYDKTGGRLKYTALSPDSLSLDDTTDSLEVVDGAQADRGSHSSVAVASDGTVRVAYRDLTAKTLRLATRADGVWTSTIVPNCGQTEEDLDCPATPDYGEYAQLFVNNGFTRIVFYDRGAGALKIAERTNESVQWSVSILDGAAVGTDVGRFANASLDALGRLGIAYFDAGRGALRFYHEADEGGGVPLVVDDGAYSHEPSQTVRRNLVGQDPAVVFDQKNHAVIVYLDATALELKLARVVGQTVAQRESLGFAPGRYISLARGVAKEGALPIYGAYGTWIPGAAPRTELRRFSVVAGAP